MGKIYEALEWHKKESRRKQWSETSSTFSIARFKPQRLQPAAEPHNHYSALKSSFVTRYGNGNIKTIMFAGVDQGDGASTTAVNFASLMAKDSQQKVLLVDSNLRKPNFHRFFNTENCYSLQNLSSGTDGSNVHQFLPPTIENDNLYVIPSGGQRTPNPSGLLESPNFQQFVADMRDKFDYTVLDAPSLRNHAEGYYLSGMVDGVVLVLECGKTEAWAAQESKKQIEEAGGRVLGVVLNKRKMYVPDWLYRWV